MGSELNLMVQVEGNLRGIMNLGEFAGCFSFTTFLVGRLFEEVLIRKEDDDSFSDCEMVLYVILQIFIAKVLRQTLSHVVRNFSTCWNLFLKEIVPETPPSPVLMILTNPYPRPTMMVPAGGPPPGAGSRQ